MMNKAAYCKNKISVFLAGMSIEILPVNELSGELFTTCN
jgi:hypothetical protein